MVIFTVSNFVDFIIWTFFAGTSFCDLKNKMCYVEKKINFEDTFFFRVVSFENSKNYFFHDITTEI